MKKLRLEIDTLAVDTLEVQSFATVADTAQRGTAVAHNLADTQVDPCLTCELSCPRGCEGGEPVQVAADWPAVPPPTGWGVTCYLMGPCGTN